jgi:hypothetical protein
MSFRVSKEIEGKRNGLHKCFIFREKKNHTFYLYSGQDFNDPHHRFVMMAKYFQANQQFRIYTTNAYKNPALFDE